MPSIYSAVGWFCARRRESRSIVSPPDSTTSDGLPTLTRVEPSKSAIIVSQFGKGYNLVKKAQRVNRRKAAINLGIIVGSALRGPDASKALHRVAEKKLTSTRIDSLVEEWKMGSADHSEPRIEWALRLRDHFGSPSPSDVARLTGERWVLDHEEMANIRPHGLKSEIAAVASTLWLTPTYVDEALERHQGFRRLR